MSTAQYQPYVASRTTRGLFPARAITARSAAGLLVIRTVSSLRPSSVIRTSTLRRRCRSIPTTCRPSYASVIVGLLFPGGDGCFATSSIRQERRPAPSSHHGERLDEFLTETRCLRDREAVAVALDLLDALVAIHPDSERLGQLDAKRLEADLSETEYQEWMELSEKGLVHRDIKPRNVILTRTGAKLLDFNIASRVGDPVLTLSGTPPYQPPDADLTRWDVSPDLFAVGVILYELLCNGHHPYPNRMPVVYEPVIDPRTIRPELNAELAQFLMKACAPDKPTVSPQPLRCSSL